MGRCQHRLVHTQLTSRLCADSHEAEGKTIDLSIGGAKFESPLTAKSGKQVTVQPVVPGAERHKPVNARAYQVW